MKRLPAFIVAGLALLAVLVFIGTDPAPAHQQPDADHGLLGQLDRAWADDPVWFDGKAEIATYQATRVIYGQPRQYTATIMTNKEHASADTKTKSADGGASGGRAVFKHHVREDVPTQKYDYHFSTMVYVGVDDFKSLKIDMGSQEDCGATFKQFVNHATPGNPSQVSWHQFSYFPNEGHRSGAYEAPASLVFHDALTLVLRGLDFAALEAANGKQMLTFDLLPDQTTTKWGPAQAAPAIVSYNGKSLLKLPYGSVRAHEVSIHDAAHPEKAEPLATYWFAADPELRHVLAQYQGADGTVYRLKTLTRDVYW